MWTIVGLAQARHTRLVRERMAAFLLATSYLRKQNFTRVPVLRTECSCGDYERCSQHISECLRPRRQKSQGTVEVQAMWKAAALLPHASQKCVCRSRNMPYPEPQERRLQDTEQERDAEIAAALLPDSEYDSAPRFGCKPQGGPRNPRDGPKE